MAACGIANEMAPSYFPVIVAHPPSPSVEVVISTYDNPASLNLCLEGLRGQVWTDFTLCVADDGSGEATQAVVDQHRAAGGLPRLRHVWQPHRGFGKNAILNLAIASSTADYLIFIDGDCVAAPGFVARHLELRRPGRFLTGGVVRLGAAATAAVTPERIRDRSVFSHAWLGARDCQRTFGDRLKAGLLPSSLAGILEVLSMVKRTWNGGNASGWRADLLAVNGFDETMGYGAEDVELGVRLNHHGARGRHLRYSAPLLHLHHARNYLDPLVFAENQRRVRELRRTSTAWAVHGIRKGGA